MFQLWIVLLGFFIKRNSSVFLAELCGVLACARTDPNEYACQWLHVSAINCFWANLICSSRTPSVPGLYKRRIKYASRLKNKSGKGLDPLNTRSPSLRGANRGYCCLATWSRQQSPTSDSVRTYSRCAAHWNTIGSFGHFHGPECQSLLNYYLS